MKLNYLTITRTSKSDQGGIEITSTHKFEDPLITIFEIIADFDEIYSSMHSKEPNLNIIKELQIKDSLLFDDLCEIYKYNAEYTKAIYSKVIQLEGSLNRYSENTESIISLFGMFPFLSGRMFIRSLPRKIAFSDCDYLLLNANINNSELNDFLYDIIDDKKIVDCFIEQNTALNEFKSHILGGYLPGKMYLSLLDTLIEFLDNPIIPHANRDQSYKTYIMIDSQSNICKIGRSRDPQQRLNTLRTGNVFINLSFVCESDVESILHSEYAGNRVSNEWFRLSEIDIDNIVRKYSFKKY